MKTDQKQPMREDYLECFKNANKKTYLYLIFGHTAYDPEVMERMKMATLADV